MKSIKSALLLLGAGIFILILVWKYTSSRTTLEGEKINLSLRRTADILLRMCGDSTSQIPPVKRIADQTWRVDLGHGFSYDDLPGVLETSLKMHGVHKKYIVAIKNCDNGTIFLGYHQVDLEKNSGIPCAGRALPDDCFYAEVTFLDSTDRWMVISICVLVFLISVIAYGIHRYYNQAGPVENVNPESDTLNWIYFGNSKLDVSAQILYCGEIRHTLTYREAKLLKLFATMPEQLLDRNNIVQQVWSDEGILVGRSVDVFVSRLRKKLSDDPTISISGVHGVGYRLEILK